MTDGEEKRNIISKAILSFWNPYQVWPPLLTEEASTVKSATNHLKWKKQAALWDHIFTAANALLSL